MDISDTYRPLRNHLRRLPLLESLGVIRAYAQHFQFRRPFPKDIQVHDSLFLAQGTGQRNLQLWELETLTREVILNSPDDAFGEKTLRNWDYFAGAINKIKDIDNAIARFYSKSDRLHELHRLAHRQFPWQRAPNQHALARYFYILSSPPLDTILRSVLGMSAKELYVTGMAFTGSTLDDLVIDNPPSTDIPDLAPDLIARFVTRFSRPLVEIRSKLGAAQKLDENYFYTFNPLVAYPMIGMTIRGRERLVVPLSTYLFRRFTDGVYYEIVGHPDFDNAFGKAFQAFAGEVIHRANRMNGYRMFAEREYIVGSDRRDTIDWIVEDESAVLFIECKTKRLRLEAKLQIDSPVELRADLERLADFVAQAYKAIRDYRAGLYPGQSSRSDVPIYPLVLTLEEWFTFGDLIVTELDARVRERLIAAGLPVGWIEEMPYSVCSAQDFERLMQVIAKRGVQDVLETKARDPEHRKWIFDSVLREHFSTDVRAIVDLFPEIFDQILPGLAADRRRIGREAAPSQPSGV